jgi:hypothetical protein
MPIIRTDEEIEAARERAQACAFAAEDAGDTDDGASAVYEFCQWLQGHSDIDPTLEMDPKVYTEGTAEPF